MGEEKKKQSRELTEEQMEQFQSWLAERWTGTKECPICATNNWTLGSHLVSPTIYRSGGGLVIGGLAYPLAMIICSNCGYTNFFNAVLIGLVPGEEEEEKAAAKKKKGEEDA